MPVVTRTPKSSPIKASQAGMMTPVAQRRVSDHRGPPPSPLKKGRGAAAGRRASGTDAPPPPPEAIPSGLDMLLRALDSTMDGPAMDSWDDEGSGNRTNHLLAQSSENEGSDRSAGGGGSGGGNEGTRRKAAAALAYASAPSAGHLQPSGGYYEAAAR